MLREKIIYEQSGKCVLEIVRKDLQNCEIIQTLPNHHPNIIKTTSKHYQNIAQTLSAHHPNIINKLLIHHQSITNMQHIKSLKYQQTVIKNTCPLKPFSQPLSSPSPSTTTSPATTSPPRPSPPCPHDLASPHRGPKTIHLRRWLRHI